MDEPKQVLSIPSSRARKAVQVAGKPSASSSKELSAKTLKRDRDEMDSYVVTKGDTLSSISRKVGISVEEIKRVNNLHTSVLKIGQVLSFPKDQNRLSEEAEGLGDEEEVAGVTQTEVEKGEAAELGGGVECQDASGHGVSL